MYTKHKKQNIQNNEKMIKNNEEFHFNPKYVYFVSFFR